MLEQTIVQPYRQRQNTSRCLSDDLDGADIQRIHLRQRELGCELRRDPLLRAAQRLKDHQSGLAEAALRQKRGKCRRAVFIRGQGKDAAARLQMRADQIQRPAVQRNCHRILQRPAEAGGGEAERGWCRNDAHFGAIDTPRERHADAEEEGVA